MHKSVDELKSELVQEIKELARDIASANSYVGLLSNEIKFRSLHEKMINLKFLERKNLGTDIFDKPIAQPQEWDEISAEPSAEEPVQEVSFNENSPENPSVIIPDSEISFNENIPPEINRAATLPPVNLDFNDQMAFQNQLFDGDKESMSLVMEVLNRINTPHEALSYLTKLEEEMQWQDKEEYAERLKELVMKRFDA